MRKIAVILCLLFSFLLANAQSYEVLNYDFAGTPVNGINIKTNLPFEHKSQMITLKIEGYNYGVSETIDLKLVWYIFSGEFTNTSISSAGSFTPEVFLTNKNGLVNIYINDKGYYTRFKVTAFAKGLGEQSSWFQGWTTADEVMQGTQAVNLAYKNNFKGTITNQGNLYSLGNVGIGTSDTKGYKLAVNGKIRAQEIKVETAGWPDYVFAKDYQLPSLQETEQHIKDKGHLPGIPSAEEVKANGVDLGEMNAKLLQKIEELTLHLIEIKKELDDLKKK
ncbi:hypothetical protein [Pedobacter sp. B4-66]|uniref:hypothetical protein n=1 Tax=Pedobacter sp. B4-66 TaxID=2817280 RepID=UPI001BDB3CA1|nr:hypothetical protein [Pedobacter sp. B4-66]